MLKPRYYQTLLSGGLALMLVWMAPLADHMRAAAQTGEPCTPLPISIGQTLSGSLSTSDCRSPVRGNAHFADRYSFSASAGAQVTIMLGSPEFDTYLYLIGPNGAVIAEDDDGAGGSNSRIPAGSGLFTLPANGTYLIEVTSYSANLIGSYTLSLSLQPAGCSFSLNPASQLFASSGGAGSVSVTAGSNCGWEVFGGANWITITSGASGNGNGTVNYAVATNPGLGPRSASLIIAGQAFTVSQAGCVSIAPVNQTFDPAGGQGSISVTAASNCQWTAPSNNDWITVTAGANGSGNGTVSFMVAANTGFSARTGSIAITGNIFTVTQAGLVCPATMINTGQTINGGLSAGDCRSSVRGQTHFADRYSFSASAGTEVAIAFSSSEFDAYLYLLGPTGALIAEDDDGAGQSNSRIPASSGFLTLPATGTYIIEVTSFGPNGAGGYAVSLAGVAQMGFEADVAPRPNGNGTLTIADWVQVGRLVANLDAATNGSEFQRADCAPKDTLGDGRLSVADWVQAGRYAAGLDPPRAAGGPMMPAVHPPTVISSWVSWPTVVKEQQTPAEQLRVLQLVELRFERGRGVVLAVEIEAQGDENALSFSLEFDAGQLRFDRAATINGLMATVNTAETAEGRLGFLFALPQGQTLPAGKHQLALVSFAALSDNEMNTIAIGFGNHPLAGEIVDAEAKLLPASYRGETAAQHEKHRAAGERTPPRLKQ